METLIIIFIAVAIFYKLFLEKNNSKNIQYKNNNFKHKNYKKSNFKQKKGDKYEKHIGKHFEEKEGLVIYNGLIRRFEDKGVDLIYINSEEIHLIQCKNWNNKILKEYHLKEIYNKLSNYDFDYKYLSPQEIQKYLQNYKNLEEIKYYLNVTPKKIRKTLYISSDKVVDLEIGKYLTLIKPNIFKYKDLKIVLKDIK